MKVNIFWFRRDLRLEDNAPLRHALNSDLPVLPVFIFDSNLTDDLEPDDGRITFIHDRLSVINGLLRKKGSSVLILKGEPETVWKNLLVNYEVNSVYAGRDYEPYAVERDNMISRLLDKQQIRFHLFKDQVIFEGPEILKTDQTPYTVFTPYRNKWIEKLKEIWPLVLPDTISSENYLSCEFQVPSLPELDFVRSALKVKSFNLSAVSDYHKFRDFPALEGITYLSPHLRFGTVSIREIVTLAAQTNEVFLNELVWREFFMQILFHFPRVVTSCFKPVYEDIPWQNNEKEFEKWCSGETGYPIVDAGMRELNLTGYMHNRVRMITAGFLCKHLLTDWRWGEAYFARKLLDYELSSNNGNWQWAAGTGCDAAPYFRIFNPELQQKRYDPLYEYIRKWVDDFGKPGYPPAIVNHDFARQRAVSAYKESLRFKLRRKGF